MSVSLQWVFLGLSTGWTFVAVALLASSLKDSSDVTDHPALFLEVLYPAGRRLRHLLRIKGRRSRDRYRALLEMMTPGEAERIRKNAEDAPFTYLCLLLPVVLSLLAVTGDPAVFFLELLLLGVLCSYFDYWLSKTVKRRHREVQREFPAMLTEMSLMVHVGITAGEAFDRVAVSGEGLLFSEMQLVSSSVQNGMPVDEALDNFSTRVPLREIKKFVSLYKQNLTKGGPDFPRALSEMAAGAWTDRKNAARVQGELAEQKLLLPTLLMFVGILLMVIVPAFQSLF